MRGKSLQSCLTLCDPMDYSPPGSPSMGFSRQEYWSGLPLPSPRDLPNPGIKHRSPILQADSLPSEPPIGPILTSSTGQFHLRNSLHFLSPIHFPDLIICPPYSHNSFPTGVFIIKPSSTLPKATKILGSSASH